MLPVQSKTRQIQGGKYIYKLLLLCMVQFYLLPSTPRAYPWGFAIFSYLAVYSQPPGTKKETIPHPRNSSLTSNTLFCVQNIDNNIDFHTFDKNSSAFLEFIERWMLHVYNKNINTIFEKEKSNRTSSKERSLRPADRTVLLQNSQKRESTNRLFYQIITL